MATIPTILRGEDTAARGRSLAINLPEGDYTGLTIRLQWCGLERSWESPASGASLRFDFSAADTLPVPLGTHFGRLGVVLADGTGYIISEDIRIRVTDDVAEATGEANAIYISPADAAHALEIDLDGIEDEPATPDALRAAWKELLARMRAAVGVALVCVGLASTARAEGRLVAQTAASGSIPWGAQVVTNVTIEGELGIDGGAVTNIVEGIVADATNGVVRVVNGSAEIDGALNVANDISLGGEINVSGNILGRGMYVDGITTAGGEPYNLYGGKWHYNLELDDDGPDRELAVKGDLAPLARTDALGTAAYKDASEFATAADEALVYQLLMGSNVVAEVTNYNSRVRAPQLRLLQLDPDTREYITVWTETNGLARTLAEAKTYADVVWQDLDDAKAPRAWSRTTSGLGADAPEGVTWISTPVTVVAGGYEYAKHVTSHGEVWVLTSNGLGLGADTNAFFAVRSGDGETLFSIEKTDSILVGVDADGISVSGGVVTIPLGVVSQDPPVCYAANSLVNAAWADLSEVGLPAWVESATVSGEPGAWVWRIETTAPSAFFQFRVLQPGATVIRNNAQTDLSAGILINGTRFYPHNQNGTLIWTTTP